MYGAFLWAHRALNSPNWRFSARADSAGEREGLNVFFPWECLRPLLQGYPAYIIPDKVIVDSCTMGACAGSQLWHFDEDEGRIAAKLPSTCGHPLSGGAGCTCWDGGGSCPGTASACLDISIMDNSAQTYGCKKHDASKGDGYCGDANQHWELRDDGTLAVSTQSKVLLTAYVLSTYYAFTFTRRRQTVDSTLPHIVRSSDHCLCLSRWRGRRCANPSLALPGRIAATRPSQA